MVSTVVYVKSNNSLDSLTNSHSLEDCVQRQGQHDQHVPHGLQQPCLSRHRLLQCSVVDFRSRDAGSAVDGRAWHIRGQTDVRRLVRHVRRGRVRGERGRGHVVHVIRGSIFSLSVKKKSISLSSKPKEIHICSISSVKNNNFFKSFFKLNFSLFRWKLSDEQNMF